MNRIRADTDINIELLKDLNPGEEFRILIKAGKMMDAIVRIRGGYRIGLREATMAVAAFKQAWK